MREAERSGTDPDQFVPDRMASFYDGQDGAWSAQEGLVTHVVCPQCGAVNRIPPVRPAKGAKCGSCHQPLFTGSSSPADAAKFERHIKQNDIPTVVDFWAPWCGPCHAMAPALEQAAAELEPRYRFLKVDTEQEPALAARYAIRSIPTLMLFSRGRLVAQTAGAMDKQRIVSWIQAHTPTAETGTAHPGA